ncbi:MAG: hypothetical protein IT198_10635 [Acidimicrobiia bacterium]|nr:hypothetical protein [Acidimicrobiia bacterium]
MSVHRKQRRTGWVLPVALVGAVAEGVWATRRLAGGASPRSTLAVDGATQCLVLAASTLDCEPDAVDTDVNWPSQLLTATAALGGMYLAAPEATAVALALGWFEGAIEAHMKGGSPWRGLQWTHLAMGVVARILAAVTGALAATIDEYRASAEASGAAVGRLTEARRISETVIDESLAVLRDLLDPKATLALSDLRRRAAGEALRLRWVLDGHSGRADPLTARLWQIAANSAARGLPVELLTRELGPCGSPAAQDALCLAIDGALHVLAGRTEAKRAVVRLHAGDGDILACTVRSRRRIAASNLVYPDTWAQTVAAVDRLGGSIAAPPPGPCDDPEWRLALPAKQPPP